MIKKVEKELNRLNVGIVYIFGSTAQGIAKRGSDIDIGIVFTDSGVNCRSFKVYEELYKLFSNVYRNKETDIVFLQDAHISLQLDAVKHGRVAYQISPEFRANYEEKIILQYCDFEPILRDFDKAILERI